MVRNVWCEQVRTRYRGSPRAYWAWPSPSRAVVTHIRFTARRQLPDCLTACADRSPRGLLVNIWFADSPNPSRYQLGNWLARLIVVHQRRLRLGEITPCEGCGGLCRLDDGGRRGVSVITLEVVSVTDTSAASPRSAPAGGVGAEQPGLACPDGVRLSLIMYRAGRQLDRGR